jgi:D-alanyl-D-alanine carboxypeptidase/D-alanyl-D-alanine-endopeptidase (penicillin-binding protein 4)
LSRLLKVLAVVVACLVVATAGGVLISRAATRRAAAGPVARTGRHPSATITPSSPAPTTTIAPATTTTTTPQAVSQLAARLDAVLAGTNSCLVVTDGATPLYLHQPGTPMAPASTQKLLVAAAALRVLGPTFRFVTQVMAPAPPVGGRVDALWLVGGGDPLLATPEFIAYQAARARVAGYPWTSLAAVADAVAAAGVRSVPGGIRGDDSRFDRLRFLPVWPASYLQDQEIGALSALPLNEGIQQWQPTTKLATDPPSFAASEVARLLVARHVAVGPSGTDQAAPAGGVVVAQVQSAPLSQIIDAMLAASDNLIAELLVREIDRDTGGVGTTAGGTATVLQQAAALGIFTSGAVMQDGSGLSPGDRATCLELLDALDLGTQPGFEPMAAGLAVAGQTGTLAARFVNSPITGKLHAKTGSIDNAGGLVGVLDVTRPLQFAFLDNQPMNAAQLVAKEDQVVAALAAYPG